MTHSSGDVEVGVFRRGGDRTPVAQARTGADGAFRLGLPVSLTGEFLLRSLTGGGSAAPAEILVCDGNGNCFDFCPLPPPPWSRCAWRTPSSPSCAWPRAADPAGGERSPARIRGPHPGIRGAGHGFVGRHPSRRESSPPRRLASSTTRNFPVRTRSRSSGRNSLVAGVLKHHHVEPMCLTLHPPDRRGPCLANDPS